MIFSEGSKSQIHITSPRFKRFGVFFLCIWNFDLAQHKRRVGKKHLFKKIGLCSSFGRPWNFERLSTGLCKVHHPHNQTCFLPESKMAFWETTSRKYKSRNPGLTSGCKINSGSKCTSEPLSPVPYNVHSSANTWKMSATSQFWVYVKAMPWGHS